MSKLTIDEAFKDLSKWRLISPSPEREFVDLESKMPKKKDKVHSEESINSEVKSYMHRRRGVTRKDSQGVSPPTKWLSLLTLIFGMILAVSGCLMVVFGYLDDDGTNHSKFLQIGGIIFVCIGLLAVGGGCFYFTFVRGRHQGRLDAEKPTPTAVLGQSHELALSPREWLRQNLPPVPNTARSQKDQVKTTPRNVTISMDDTVSTVKTPRVEDDPSIITSDLPRIDEQSMTLNAITILRGGQSSKSTLPPLPLTQDTKVPPLAADWEDLISPPSKPENLKEGPSSNLPNDGDKGSLTNVFIADPKTPKKVSVPSKQKASNEGHRKNVYSRHELRNSRTEGALDSATPEKWSGRESVIKYIGSKTQESKD